METLDRLYEALILNPYDRCAMTELWSLLRSRQPDVRQAAEETLNSLVVHGYLKFARAS